MKTFRNFCLTEANTFQQLEDHVNKLSKKLKLSGPVKKLPGQKMIMFKTALTPQQVFDILIKAGYKKGQGYDPNPKTWNMNKDREAMSFRSDRIFFGKSGSFIMANVEGEQGSNLEVVFSAQ